MPLCRVLGEPEHCPAAIWTFLQLTVGWLKVLTSNTSYSLIFTALYGMQTRSSDGNSVCLSVRPSVCLSNAWIVTKLNKKSVQILIPYEWSFSLSAFDWYLPRWPWMILNGVIDFILRFLTEFDCFAGQLRHRGWRQTYNAHKILPPIYSFPLLAITNPPCSAVSLR